jgi:hypothetical protein
VKNDYGLWVSGRNILDELILEFREGKRPILTFTLVFVADAGSDNHSIIPAEIRRRC